MGSRRVTTFVENGEEYDVIVQADARTARARPTSSDPGARARRRADAAVEPGDAERARRARQPQPLQPPARDHLQRGPRAGLPLGEAIEWLEQTAREELPEHAQIDWKGESREYRTAGGAVLLTFALALLIVYLVLAAQFESFIHPFVIMLTVPLAVLGALIGLAVTGGTLNLFSQIGIVMLVGLAAKNGILIVEFANQLRDEGRSVREAIVEAVGRAPASDPDDLDRDRGGRGAAGRWPAARARPAARPSASW